MQFPTHYNGMARWTVGKDGWDVLWVISPAPTIAGAMLCEFAEWYRHTSDPDT